MVDNIRVITDLPQLPPKVRVGVLYKDMPIMGGMKHPITGEPLTQRRALYIVEYITDPTSIDMVIVYGVEPSSNPPVKAFTKQEETLKYNHNTPLSLYAQQKGRKSKRTYTVEKPPIFVSPVYEGVDTFTNHYGLGFHERTQDKVTAKGLSQSGESTNVFITLESITWEREKVLTSDVIRDIVAIRDVWFDL